MARTPVAADITHEVMLRIDIPRPKLDVWVYGPGYDDPKKIVCFSDKGGGQALEDLLVAALAEVRATRRHGGLA